MERTTSRPGDAVTIAGCTKHTENNKTPVIREIDGDKMYFYEYVFTLDGDNGDDAVHGDAETDGSAHGAGL